MGECVSAQIAVPPEYFATGVAFIRLVVGVSEQMRFQIAALVEAAVAHLALVRRLVQMHLFVHGQSARLAEPFATVQALERFIFRVNESVTTNIRAYLNTVF